MRQMFSLHLFSAPFGVPFFLFPSRPLSFGQAGWRKICRCALLALAAVLVPPALADAVVTLPLPAASFQSAHEALVEAIESEGLKLGTVLPVGEMMQRTAGQLDRPLPTLRQAEVVQFCSARLALDMAAENWSQLVYCPQAIVVYAAEPSGAVFLAYRLPEPGSPARRAAGEMLERVARHAQRLAPLH